MIKPILLALSLLIYTPYNVDINKLIGTWHIDKVIYMGKEKTEPKFLEFLEDGKLQAGIIGEKASKFGKWAYNEKDSILTLTSIPKRVNDGDYKLLKLTDDILILGVITEGDTDMVEIHLKKI